MNSYGKEKKTGQWKIQTSRGPLKNPQSLKNEPKMAKIEWYSICSMEPESSAIAIQCGVLRSGEQWEIQIYGSLSSWYAPLGLLSKNKLLFFFFVALLWIP